MATDTTNISTETVAGNQLQEGDVEQGHLTQSNAPVPVQVPAGENVVRIQVTPGETLQLPFPTDGLVAKLSPDNANLAVKVGDITVILLGYSEATAVSEVTLLGSDGQPVDVVTVLANTDPNLDIATAAGPGAGDQGTGADNNGGLFTPFDPAAGIGGLNAIGGLDPTALNYNLVQREFPELLENDEIDTTPTLVNISQGAVINEDDLSLGDERQFKLPPDQDGDYQSQIGNELAKILGPGWSASTGGKQGDGNDPFDTTDNEGETPGAVDDNGYGVDLDREPLTSTAVININFHQDVPGKISFQNGGTIPLLDQLQAMGLTSHGHELLFKLLPAVADDLSTPGIDESHGEALVAYYVSEGEGAEATIVFSIGVREQNGDNATDFHIDFTIYGPIDNLPSIADANGDISDIFDIDVPFYMVDSDGSVTPAPTGANGVNFHSIDDIPAFGELGMEGGEGNDVGHWVINPTNSSVVHDETDGVQSGGSAIGGDGDIDPTTQNENDADIDVSGILSHVGWSGLTPIGAAETEITVSFGADGKAEGNKEAGKTVFTGDGDANATAYQLFIGDAANPLEGGQTNWTITVNGQVLAVYAEQVDANTIIGYAQDGETQIPVFILTINPNGGWTGSDLTLVQLHQVNQGDPTAGDESTPPLIVYGPDESTAEISVRATDFDGDSIDKSLTIEIQDDAPTVGANNLVKLDDDALPGGNAGGTGDDINAQNVTGTLTHSYGTDGTGTLLLTGATLPDGFTVAVSDGGKTLIISQDGVEVLKVALSDDTNGSYTVTQLAAIHHPAGQDENNLDFTVNYQVKDSDGDTANGTLAINVDDDTPKVTGVHYDTPLLGIVDEDKLPGGIEGGPLDIGAFGASIGGKVLVAPGADQPVTFTFAESTGTAVDVLGLALPPTFALTDLNGNPVTLVVDNGGTPATLKGVAAGVDIFTITLDKATGEFTFTLNQPVKHPSDGNPFGSGSLEDSLLTLGFNVKVTDADGDSDTAQLYFKINDDTPTVADNAKIQLDDDALAGGNAGGTGDDADGLNVTGTLAHNYGADGAGTTLLTGATLPNNQGFTQSLSSDGLTLTISQSGTPVLQIVLTDTSSGSYTVTQLAAIKHPAGSNENNVEFTIKYNVTDGDGDTVGGQVKINVDDDTPILNPNAAAITVTIEEDGMSLSTADKSEGNKDAGDSNSDDEAAGLAGSLSGLYLAGADKPLTISMLTNTSGLPALMSGGVAVTYSVSNGVLTAKAGANVVFTLTVNSDGSWAFDLQDQLDHVAGNGENNALKLVGGGSVDAIDFSALIVATDNDGDKAPALPAGKFAIAIQDDVPVANDDHQFMKESEHTITGNVLTGDGKDGDTATDLPAQADHVGADEPGRITQVHSINVNGPVTNVDNGDNALDGDTVVVQGQYGKLTINEDGTYSYTLDPAFDINTLTADPVHLGRSGTGATASEWVAQGFSMTATKFDGSVGTISYDANGIGVSGTKPGLQVPGQIGYDPNTQTTEKITLAFDCPVNSLTVKVSNLYNNENDGEQGTWKAYDANGNVIGQGLFGPGADNPATGYIHVNFGGSTNVGTFTIDVGDTQMEGIAKIEFGATEYGPNNNAGNPNTDSSDYYIREVTYVPAVVQEHFDYTLTDKDGDTDNAVLTIDVCDNVPSPRAGNAAGLVTEDTLPGGSNDDPASAPASSVYSGTLPIYNGTVSNLTFDDPASSLDGAPVKSEDASSITLTQAGEWTITINKSTGAFTFTLLDDQAHGDATKIYGADTLIGKFIATVSGSGGADATGSITITVNDDGPKADVVASSDTGVILETQDKDTTGLLSDTATSTANFGGVFSFLKSGGADGEASSALTFSLNVNAADSGLTSGGAVIHLYKIAGVVVGSTAADALSVTLANTIFTVEVNAAGEVKLTQFQQIDHGLSESVPSYDDDVRTLADGKISLTATGTITDGDGDKATDSATVDLGGNIRFDDDGPKANLSEGALSIRLDESIGVDVNDPNAANDDAASVGFIGKQTGSVTGLFGTPDYGADGQGAAPEYQLVLKDAGGLATALGTTNVATNLSVVDTANAYANDNIVLVSVSAYQVNGYVGSYDPSNVGSAVLAFTVQVDPATGVVTVEQKLPIAHDFDGASGAAHDDLASLLVSGQAGGGIFAAQTVTDGDGDKSTVVSPSSIGIDFEDDGPTVISASSNLPVDEDALLGGNAGGPGDGAGGATANFNVSVDFGSDGKAAVPFALTGIVTASDGNDQPITLKSFGQTLVFTVLDHEENGYPAGTLVGWSGPALNDHLYWIFTITIDAQTGAGTFNLLKPLDHPVSGTEDDLTIAFGVRATDGDGDFANATVSVVVDDDTPVAVDDPTLKVTEIGGIVDGTNLLDNDHVGADTGGRVIGIRLGGENGAYTVVDGGGTDINIKADGSEGTPAVGVLHVNTNGSWTFTQLSGSELPNLTFSYQMQDRDGDTDTASFQVDLDSVPTITVTNTSPATTAGQALVDEDFLTAGNHDATASTGDDAGGASATGSWSTSHGDPTVTVTVDGIINGVTATGATALDGSAILWFTSGSGLPAVLHGKTTAGGSDFFTLTVNANGTWQFDLLQPVKHSGTDSEDPNVILNSVTLKATDADGDTATAQIKIAIDDDMPLAVDDSTLTITTIGVDVAGTNLLTNDHIGGDQGGQVVGIRLGGESGLYTAVGAGGTDISVKADGLEGTPAIGTLHVNQDGSWTFKQLTGSELPNLTFSYKVTDADGDTDTASFQVNLDSVPTITVTPNSPTTQAGEALVDEDFLAAGNHDTTPSVGDDAGGASATGTWQVQNGDPTVTITIDGIISGVTATGAMALDGSAILWFASGSGLPAVLHGKTSADGSDYFTLTINTNGTWKFDLLQPVKHSGVDSEDPNVILNSVTLKATDSDGDTSTAQIKIAIDDDSPVAVDDTTLSITTIGLATAGTNLLTNDHAGADQGGQVVGIRLGGEVGTYTAVGAGGVNIDIKADGTEGTPAIGTLHVNQDGSWTFTQTGSSELAPITFSYQMKDGDGDTDTASFQVNLDSVPTITVTPTSPTTQAGEALVDEDYLAAGNHDATPSIGDDAGTTSATGNWSTSNGDPTVTVTVDGVVNGVTATGATALDGSAILWFTSSNGLPTVLHGKTSVGGADYFILTINANGTWQFDLLQPVKHSGVNSEDPNVLLNGVVLKATDADGDTATAQIKIAIDDDMPVARDDADSAGNHISATGNVITGIGTTDPIAGADTKGADGAMVSGASEFVVNGQYGQLFLQANGEYFYIRFGTGPLEAVDHFTYTLTDADGDSSVAKLDITIADKGVTLDVPTTGEAGTTVYEAGLPAGSTETADGIPNNDNSEKTSGTVTFTTPDGFGTLMIKGVSAAPGVDIVGTYGTLHIDSVNLATGQLTYTYTLTTNTAGDTTHDDFSVQVVDSDGDSTSLTLTVDIVDDVPTARDDADSVAEGLGNQATGNVITGLDTTNPIAGADTKGADGAVVSGLTGPNGSDNDAAGGFTVTGLYGTLALQADGSYVYTLTASSVPAGATESFTYTLTDG
ncbi:MAG: hypothetical protein HYU58_17355, partial [Proteobacteria bacterium]|nr:hypothetical protein [Pseudomonadota bacterium]